MGNNIRVLPISINEVFSGFLKSFSNKKSCKKLQNKKKLSQYGHL